MGTIREDIVGWLKQAQDQGATHMIVATDTFDYGDYPVFVMPGYDAAAKVQELSDAPMSKVMECYNMRLPLDEQLSERRAFHIEP